MASLKKLLDQAKEHLEPGERVEAAIHGAYETKMMGNATVRQGILAATDRRLVFYAKKLGGYDLEHFPYENISSFEQGKNMMGQYNIRFFASGNEVAMKWVTKEGFQAFADLVRGRVGKKLDSSAPVPAVPAQGDPIEQLRRLGELRDAGVVTPEEFEAKKAQLLAQI